VASHLERSVCVCGYDTETQAKVAPCREEEGLEKWHGQDFAYSARIEMPCIWSPTYIIQYCEKYRIAKGLRL
jgi:hypothetical protein